MAESKGKDSMDTGVPFDSGLGSLPESNLASLSMSDVPKHGLNSGSLNSKGFTPQQPYSTESGCSSHPPSSEDASHLFEPHSEEPQKVSHQPARVFTDFLKFYSFLVNLYPNPYEWSKDNFRGTLSKAAVEAAGHAMWTHTAEDEDEDFEAINAAREGDDRAVLFAKFVAPNAETLNTRNLDRQTVLHVAAELLDYRVVRSLITSGADGAMTDLWGNTPLHIASRLGRGDVVRALTTPINRKEMGQPRYKVPYKSLPQDNKNQMNNDAKAPIHLAAQGGHADTCRALAEAKVDLDQRRPGDGYTALHIAIDNGDMECLRTLLELDADLEVPNYRGQKPQQLAHLCGRQDMVDLCAEFGASPNQLELAETEWSSSEESDEMDTTDDNLSGSLDHLSLH